MRPRKGVDRGDGVCDKPGGDEARCVDRKDALETEAGDRSSAVADRYAFQTVVGVR